MMHRTLSRRTSYRVLAHHDVGQIGNQALHRRCVSGARAAIRWAISQGSGHGAGLTALSCPARANSAATRPLPGVAIDGEAGPLQLKIRQQLPMPVASPDSNIVRSGIDPAGANQLQKPCPFRMADLAPFAVRIRA